MDVEEMPTTKPASVPRRLAAGALDGVLLGWLFAWLLLPLPWLPAWGMLLLAIAYLVVGEGAQGRTIGKKALALDVVAATSGGRAGLRRAVLRSVVKAIPVLPLVVVAEVAPRFVPAAALLGIAALVADMAWALGNPLRRTLHDLAAATVVLRRGRQRLFRLDGDHPWARGDARP